MTVVVSVDSSWLLLLGLFRTGSVQHLSRPDAEKAYYEYLTLCHQPPGHLIVHLSLFIVGCIKVIGVMKKSEGMVTTQGVHRQCRQ